MKLTISCLQFDIAYGNPSENFKKAEQLIEQESRKADILLLPELWTTGYDLKNLGSIADEEGRQTKMAAGNGKSKPHPYRMRLSRSQEKKRCVQYHVHRRQKRTFDQRIQQSSPFSLMDEHLYLSAGSGDGRFELEGMPAAGFICYDIRFPEWIRKHTSEGAGIIFVSAEWPLARLDHWQSLLKARAIENQCFVAACNRSGKDPANEFAGHSTVIDPLGRTLAEAGRGEAVIRAEIDLRDIEKARGQIPVFEDIAKTLY